MTTPLIEPEGPLGTSIVGLFDQLGRMQDTWQHEHGFGEEGDFWRGLVEGLKPEENSRLTLISREHLEAALRNYYLAKLVLIDTEVTEVVEEIRKGKALGETYYSTYEMREDLGREVPGKPEGALSEGADIIIRVLSLFGEAGLSRQLGEMVVEKLNYNDTRAHRNGGKAI